MRNQLLRILCPNRHLGFMMAEEESFRRGAETHPDYYCCNSGSTPNDPAALGMDTGLSLYQWQKHDLALMLLTSRKQGVPMIIGSAGDTGANSRVDLYVNLIQRLAWQHNLPPFKLIYFYSEIPKETLRRWMENGLAIEEPHEKKHLTVEELEQTERILAVAHVHPFIQALESGADVIIGGRSDPAAVSASAALYEGFPEQISYSLGRALNTPSIFAEPLMTHETIIGTITPQHIEVTAMRPGQQNSAISFTGQTPQEQTRNRPISIEGAGKVGERFMAIVEVRDSTVIAHIDKVIEWAQYQIATHFSEKNYQLSYKIYEKDKVIGDLKPLNACTSQKLGLVIEGIAETEQIAEEITLMGSRQLLSAPLPGKQKNIETAAVIMKGIFPAPPVYRRTIYHVLPEEKPGDLFPLHELMIE